MMMKKAGSPMIEVNWNQFFQNGDFASGDFRPPFIYAERTKDISVVNGVFTGTQSVAPDDNSYLLRGGTQADTYYYLSAKMKSQSNRMYMMFAHATKDWIDTGNQWTRASLYGLSTLQGNHFVVGCNDRTATYYEFSIKDVYCINVTQLLGVGNEPPTAELFEGWLVENGINPDEYIPYNAGEIKQMTKPSWL